MDPGGGQGEKIPAEVPTPPYAGRHEHTLDDKFRLIVPAEWRGGRYPTELYLFPSAKGCLKAMPSTWLEKKQEQVKHLPLDDPRREAVTDLGSIAQRLAWDGQGRVRVDDEFLDEAGIAWRAGGDRKVVLLGKLDHFEVWAADRQKTAPRRIRNIEEAPQ